MKYLLAHCPAHICFFAIIIQYIALIWILSRNCIIICFSYVYNAAVSYAIQPMQPTGDFLRNSLCPKIPVGTTYDYPDVDRTRVDNRLLVGISTWMIGWSLAGEAGLISRNDGLFRVIFSLGGLTYGMRDCHDNSTTTRTRSDVTLGFDGCALVLAEEKDMENIDNAVEDLRRKFQWIDHFHRIPFVFGIAINRSHFQVFAMTANEMQSIFHSPIVTDADRWSCVVASVNIARILRLYIEHRLFIPITINMNMWINRSHGKRIRIGLFYVEVAYDDSVEFERLKTFYQLAFDVPHMERLKEPATDKFRLIPVGIQRRPESVQELRSALLHILECITALHILCYCHCDIRWSNIICADREWYLIDCTFATHLSDTPRLQLLSSSIIKSSFVFSKNLPWSIRHDYFQIGLLLSEQECSLSPPFRTLRTYLCDRDLDIVDMEQIKSILNLLPTE